MKQKLLLNLLVMCISFFSFAQPNFSGKKGGGERGEKLEALKVAYLTKYLNLSVDEAQKFWPMYNAYIAEIKQSRKNNLQDELAFGEAVLNIRKKYKADFKKILNDDVRLNNVYKAESEFRNELQKELKKRHQAKMKEPQ